MTREIKIQIGDYSFETRSFVFPGGELQVQVPGLSSPVHDEVTVTARLQSSDDIMRLLLATDIVDRHHRWGRRRLVVPYFPYARQDRVMQAGEAFSLKAVSRIINGLGYDEVVVCDPHSDVTPALIDKVRVVSQLDLIRSHGSLNDLIQRAPIIIAPDAGAAKKAYNVASFFSLSILTASKMRGTNTGMITGTRLDDPHRVNGRACLIVDDICDGGRTFIELAKVLREHGASHVYLYVTHAIFSKGLKVFNGLIDGIYTTNSFVGAHSLDGCSTPVFASNIDQKGLIS